jgi:hypothetical protein
MRPFLGCLAATALLLGACSDDDGDPVAGSDEGPFDSPTELLGDADEGIDGVQSFRVHYPAGQGSPHRVGDIVYGLEPPVGGLHDQVPAECGFYDEPVREENVGHSLEHGAVWLAYDPDLAEEDVERLQALVRDNDEVLASPYEGLDAGTAVVASAWARQLTLDSVDDPRLAEFVAEYQNGDQHPEPGVPC